MPYALTMGLPGLYMPDVCEHHWTKKDAQASAVFWADTYRDEWGDGAPAYRVEGSARSGRYDVFDLERIAQHIACIEVSEIGLGDFAPECVCGRETEPTIDGPKCPECGLDVRD